MRWTVAAGLIGLAAVAWTLFESDREERASAMMERAGLFPLPPFALPPTVSGERGLLDWHARVSFGGPLELVESWWRGCGGFRRAILVDRGTRATQRGEGPISQSSPEEIQRAIDDHGRRRGKPGSYFIPNPNPTTGGVKLEFNGTGTVTITDYEAEFPE